MRIICFLDAIKPTEGGIHIPYLSGCVYRIISDIENRYIKEISLERLSLNNSSSNETITVSLTSFPARIEIVGYAIKSLFNQTVKPDRIVLWLAKAQFPDRRLPQLLKDLQDRGLEIVFCDDDLKAHKKYHYALREQKKNELVITYDDDLIYPENSIELLIKKHLEFPDCIVCNRAQCSSINGDKFNPYNSWKVFSEEGVLIPSKVLFPSTGGGTLYPYGAVNEEAFNTDDMRKLAFSADDLWMRYMSALNQTKVIKTRKRHKIFSVIGDSQGESLQIENCLNGGNDRAIELLNEAFPQVRVYMFE